MPAALAVALKGATAHAALRNENLAAVGSRIILMAPVVHQLRGDERRWDRVAIAQYRTRVALM